MEVIKKINMSLMIQLHKQTNEQKNHRNNFIQIAFSDHLLNECEILMMRVPTIFAFNSLENSSDAEPLSFKQSTYN